MSPVLSDVFLNVGGFGLPESSIHTQKVRVRQDLESVHALLSSQYFPDCFLLNLLLVFVSYMECSGNLIYGIGF